MDEKKDPKTVKNAKDAAIIEAIEQAIQKCVERAQTSKNLSRPLTEKEKKELTEHLRAVYIEGRSPKDVMKIEDAVINQIYTYAYNLYQSGKYSEAAQIFLLLTTLDNKAARNMMGLAACFHKMQKYSKAAEIYFATSLLDLSSPIPFFHMADCYMQLDDPLDAHIALSAAAKRCGNDPTYATLKSKCYAMLTALKKVLPGNEEPENGKTSSFDLIRQSGNKDSQAA